MKRADGDRKPFVKREDGDRKPFVKREDGGRKPYAARAEGGERKPYAPRTESTERPKRDSHAARKMPAKVLAPRAFLRGWGFGVPPGWRKTLLRDQEP